MQSDGIHTQFCSNYIVILLVTLAATSFNHHIDRCLEFIIVQPATYIHVQQQYTNMIAHAHIFAVHVHE